MKDIILKAETFRNNTVGPSRYRQHWRMTWTAGGMKLGKENPYLKNWDSNDRATKGMSTYGRYKTYNFEVERGEVLYIGKNGAGSLLYSRYYRLQHHNRKH
jgi:hypothetical protein